MSAQLNDRQPLPFLKQGVAQIALVVADLDGTVERWWSLFGIGPWHFYTYGPDLVPVQSYSGKPARYSMRLALSTIGPLRVELIELGEGETIYADFVREHGYGVHHLGLQVDDMQTALALAKDRGWAVTQEGAGFGRDGDGHYAYLDTEAALGVALELIERPQGRVPPEKVYPPEAAEQGV